MRDKELLAIGAVGLGGYLLWKASKGITQTGEGIGEAFVGTGTGISTAVKGTGEGIADATTGLGSGIGSIGREIGETFKAPADLWQNIFGTLDDTVSTGRQVLRDRLRGTSSSASSAMVPYGPTTPPSAAQVRLAMPSVNTRSQAILASQLPLSVIQSGSNIIRRAVERAPVTTSTATTRVSSYSTPARNVSVSSVRTPSRNEAAARSIGITLREPNAATSRLIDAMRSRRN